MKETHSITYGGQEFIVKEPTLDTWGMISTHIDFQDDLEMAVSLISWVTGLSEQEIGEASASSVLAAAEGIIDYYVNQSQKFYETFEHAGKTFKFIDLQNITFGQWIDIDDYLNLPEVEKKKKLNLFMSFLYHEVDEKGKPLPYDVNRIKENAELFRKLPVKYLNGAMVFFYHIGNMLRENTPHSFLSIWWWIQKTADMKRWIKTHLGGIQRLYSYLVKTYSTLTRWLKGIIWRSSTFSPTSKT